MKGKRRNEDPGTRILFSVRVKNKQALALPMIPYLTFATEGKAKQKRKPSRNIYHQDVWRYLKGKEAKQGFKIRHAASYRDT